MTSTVATEDDTFRKLRQAPYDEANRVWRQVLKEGFSVAEAIDALKKIGWTKNEYYKAYSKYGDDRG